MNYPDGELEDGESVPFLQLKNKYYLILLKIGQQRTVKDSGSKQKGKQRAKSSSDSD